MSQVSTMRAGTDRGGGRTSCAVPPFWSTVSQGSSRVKKCRGVLVWRLYRTSSNIIHCVGTFGDIVDIVGVFQEGDHVSLDWKKSGAFGKIDVPRFLIFVGKVDVVRKAAHYVQGREWFRIKFRETSKERRS